MRICKQIAVAAIGVCLFFCGFVGAQYDVPQKINADMKPFQWPQGKRAAISLTFDDARLSQIDNGLPLLDRFRVKATFFVTPRSVADRISGWQQAVRNGHEIGNHTMTHPCTGNYPAFRQNALEEMDLDAIAREIDGATRFIVGTLGVEPVSFAYPCGQTFVGRGREVKSYVPLVAQRFRFGRKWLNEDANDPVFCDLSQLLALESDGKTFDQLRIIVDKAAREGRWLILCGHEINRDGFQTTFIGTLEKLCRYAQDPANGIWIDTMDRVGTYIAQKRAESVSVHPPEGPPLYLNPGLPLEARVEDLLGRMTLEEKVGQMNMPCVYQPELGRDVSGKTAGCRRFAEGTYLKNFGPAGGFFTLPNTILLDGPRQQAEYLNELQTIALRKTRLQIPLLETEEGTHGLMCSGATIFPEGLALGSTWDLDLISKIYGAAAKEARAIGVHQIFTLVVEPVRDPRLGRNQEAYSEDPFLCSRIAETIVKAVQGDDVSSAEKCVAGLCHFPGQSQPVSGLERGAMEISPRTLREVFLPPWEAGIRKGRALGVMATYPAIDGIPTHASEEILTGILREEFGFEGLVLSEGGGIGTLVYEGLAATQKAAGCLAIRAGVDVGISFESGYMGDLIESVKEGNVPISQIDRAVRRILRQKFRLGLFENRFVDPSRAEQVVHNRAHQDLALQAAREGVVLLKNEKNLLPLRKSLRSIAVIGPNADHRLNQLGDYVSTKVPQTVTTVLQGIRNAVSSRVKISYVKGCDVLGTESGEIEKARRAAAGADVAIVVVGENEWQTAGRKGTDGEGFDAASLDLTGLQQNLIRAVVESGTPTVAVLVNGRPLSICYLAERVPAILETWCSGEKGGQAIAEILFGDRNPAGKLPITIPRHSGQLPAYYNSKKSKTYWMKEGWGHPYVDMEPTPLYPFGHGLSYTTFAYGNLRISAGKIGSGDPVEIEAEIRNTGTCFGEEVVQLYVQDVISSVSTPVMELKGFTRVGLEPGQKRIVNFRLTPELLSLVDRNLERVVEPGQFKVMIGSSCEDIRLRGDFVVTGD